MLSDPINRRKLISPNNWICSSWYILIIGLQPPVKSALLPLHCVFIQRNLHVKFVQLCNWKTTYFETALNIGRPKNFKCSSLSSVTLHYHHCHDVCHDHYQFHSFLAVPRQLYRWPCHWLTDWLQDIVEKHYHTYIQHSERLVTLETCDESDEETWPDQPKDHDRDKENEKHNDKYI